MSPRPNFLREKHFSTMLRRAVSQLSQTRLGFLPAFQTLQNPAFLSCRNYSVASAPTADLSASTVTIENTKSPKQLTPAPELLFGHTFTGNAVLFMCWSCRSYVNDWVDFVKGVVTRTNYTLPKPFFGSSDLRFPLRIRMFWGNEGI